MSLKTGRWCYSASASAMICLYSCGLCHDDVLQEAANPGGSIIARSYIRDCGATTDFASIVQLRPTSSRFDPDDGSGVVLDIKGRHPIELEWVTRNALRLRCASCGSGDVLSRKTNWQEVTITYSEPDSGPTGKK
jgi:hypothetical protein